MLLLLLWSWSWPDDLENIISSSSAYSKYLCKFWFTSLQWIRNYWVHKISMVVTAGPWPLTLWPWKCCRWQVDLIMSNCDEFCLIICPNCPCIPRDIKVKKLTHPSTDGETQPDRKPENIMLSGYCCWQKYEKLMLLLSQLYYKQYIALQTHDTYRHHKGSQEVECKTIESSKTKNSSCWAC